MKRFWTAVSVEAEGNEYLIRLDGKPLKLPSGKEVRVPFFSLAAEIAEEWDTIGGIFSPDDLPLTRLATTAQDRVALNRAEIISQLVGFGMNDLLCYRAADQPELAQHEALAWEPWTAWAARKFDVALKITAGILPVQQSPECRVAFARYLDAMTVYQLAGLGVIVPVLGSLVLGLAVEAEALSAEAASDCANLGELWQEARWGKDEDATTRRLADARDVAISTRFMALCRA
jgi:chaperone required for assembly of F1-ATPase